MAQSNLPALPILLTKETKLLEPNKSSSILHLMEEIISKFEASHGSKSGFFLGLVSAGILAFTCMASEIYMPKLPSIEIIFVAYLVAFLFNYYLIRDGDLLPFIEVESQNFVAKVSGLSGLICIILFVYSFQKCELQTSLFCFGVSWIFYATFESCSKKQKRLSLKQFFCGLLMVGLTYAILIPNFTHEFRSVSQPTANQDVDTTVNYVEDYSHLYGVIASLLSGIFFGYMSTCIRSLKNQNFITVTHIFTYIQAPFIPVFFPLQKLISPSLTQWIFMAGLGIIFVLALQLFIRSSQLQETSKSLLSIPQYIAFLAIFSILLGVSPFGTITEIKVLSGILIIILSLYFTSDIPERSTVINDEDHSNNILLQTFSKEDKENLNKKLLDNENK